MVNKNFEIGTVVFLYKSEANNFHPYDPYVIVDNHGLFSKNDRYSTIFLVKNQITGRVIRTEERNLMTVETGIARNKAILNRLIEVENFIGE